jgi:hypothetical protein
MRPSSHSPPPGTTRTKSAICACSSPRPRAISCGAPAPASRCPMKNSGRTHPSRMRRPQAACLIRRQIYRLCPDGCPRVLHFESHSPPEGRRSAYELALEAEQESGLVGEVTVAGTDAQLAALLEESAGTEGRGLSKLTPVSLRSKWTTGDDILVTARILPSHVRAGGYDSVDARVEVEYPTRPWLPWSPQNRKPRCARPKAMRSTRKCTAEHGRTNAAPHQAKGPETAGGGRKAGLKAGTGGQGTRRDRRDERRG